MTRRLVSPSGPSADRPVRIPPHMSQQREDLDAAIKLQLSRVRGLVRSKVVSEIERVLDRAIRGISTASMPEDERPRVFTFDEVVISRGEFSASEEEFNTIRHSLSRLTKVQIRYLEVLYLNIFERKSYEDLEFQFSLSESNVKASVSRGRKLITAYASENLRRILCPNIKIKIEEPVDPQTPPSL